MWRATQIIEWNPSARNRDFSNEGITMQYKKLCSVLFALLLLALGGCADSTDTITSSSRLRAFTEAELAARMSAAAHVPEEVLSPDADSKFSARYQRTFGALKRGGDNIPRLPLTLDEAMAIAGSVVARNPDAFAPTERDYARISRDFGGLTLPEIDTNIEGIRRLYEAKLRHETLAQMERQLALPRGPAVGPSFVTSCEAWYIANFPARSWDTKRAADDAARFTVSYYGVDQDQVRGNAFKHAVWNALIPVYTGKYFLSIEGAMDWAKRITDAHECGSSGLATAMDYHNNAQGRNFIRNYLYVHVNWAGRSVRGPDETFIRSQIKWRADKAVYVTSAGAMGGYPNSLVFTRW
jgi:hypothetical protein